MRKVIDNGIVEMDWDADLYFETDEGFYAAVNVYEGEDGMDVPVIFQIFGDAVVAFLLLDDDTHQPADIEDIVSVIKDSYTEDFAISEVLDGYVELGENERQTAIREIKEETDLDVKIHPGFRETSDYCPFGKVRKRVVFFLAEAVSDNVHIQESEIDYYIWVPFSQARDMCCYENDLRVIDKAERYLGGGR